MSKLPLIVAVTTALLIVSGGSNAQENCTTTTRPITAFATEYHGYSNKASTPGAPGNSTIGTSTSITEERCIVDGASVPVGSYKTTETNYTNGPGNSPFEKRNPVAPPTCFDATGTLSCP
jgi:hypothetical protein